MTALFYIFITILSFTLIKLIIYYAPKLGLIDIPNERSSHADLTPRGAGIGFVVAVFIGVALFRWDLVLSHWYLFLAIFMVFIIGVFDDHKDAPPKAKFIVIFAATALMWWYGLSIESLGEWFGYELTLGWLALPFSMLALAGFTNALNLIDGLNGLSGSISIVIIGFFGYFAYVNDNDIMWILASFTIASLVGFMLLNWHPAKIFMGDSGSLALGFIISILAVFSVEYIHPVSVLYIAAIPILDTLIVMVRRIRRGRSPFSPDRTHLHHILANFFLDDVKRTVWFLILLQISFSGIGVIVHSTIKSSPNEFLPFFALGGFVMLFLIFYMIFSGMNRRQLLLDGDTY
ncbi:MAG: Undecaprenyl-phosphate N-acetylglucosaminyl 1-phosphate transferase (EC [uncultured Sulfurovum sp.]|uniref:Undecaprenyl-phosphate N-acetylglucosaminyl 1-phosphate transferase (EC) n=1 Tax=uncultured Sulfurovum sp. TaxID=269237 RepID=A0A6S6TWE5_9BACT|nr:MAG: Undecaprenyl-phosphate N-acetylglucosaminyl 1-phosphate transferase (EC [uncultured Sulfurovum sp.]